MADFCRQCNKELFDLDESDFSNPPLSPEKLAEGFGWPELCEDCGFILTGNNGECIDRRCPKHGSIPA